jgi:hypothetical protein
LDNDNVTLIDDLEIALAGQTPAWTTSTQYDIAGQVVACCAPVYLAGIGG